MTTKLLRIDASARRNGSVTRDLNDQVIAKLEKSGPVSVTKRDLADPLPHVTEDWIGANFTAKDDRTEAQRAVLELSDRLVAELKSADVVLIGLPIYNFGAPAALKSWIDLIARVGETFRYTENGPIGLLERKRAIVTVASGGTQRGSDIDFATSHLSHVLKFIGITDVSFVSADRLAIDTDASMASAQKDIQDIPLAA